MVAIVLSMTDIVMKNNHTLQEPKRQFMYEFDLVLPLPFWDVRVRVRVRADRGILEGEGWAVTSGCDCSSSPSACSVRTRGSTSAASGDNLESCDVCVGPWSSLGLELEWLLSSSGDVLFGCVSPSPLPFVDFDISKRFFFSCVWSSFSSFSSSTSPDSSSLWERS